jgi:hypothetical protein
MGHTTDRLVRESASSWLSFAYAYTFGQFSVVIVKAKCEMWHNKTVYETYLHRYFLRFIGASEKLCRASVAPTRMWIPEIVIIIIFYFYFFEAILIDNSNCTKWVLINPWPFQLNRSKSLHSLKAIRHAAKGRNKKQRHVYISIAERMENIESSPRFHLVNVSWKIMYESSLPFIMLQHTFFFYFERNLWHFLQSNK